MLCQKAIIIELLRIGGGKMELNELTVHIKHINQLSKEDQRYLYGECDKWCLNNFEEGMQIVAIMERNNHENGITHSYLRNPKTGYCYDIRGESGNNKEILLYTGVNYESSNIEEYVFNRIEDFKRFLKWVEFECMREYFLVG